MLSASSPLRRAWLLLILLVTLTAAPLAAQATATDAEVDTSGVPEPAADEATTPRVEFRDGLRITAGPHSVAFRVLSQFRFVHTREDAQHASTFQLTMLRPSVRGSFFDGLVGVFIQPELAGDHGRILDAELTLNLHPAFSVTVGQFITPASRAFMTPVPVLMFPDFSVVSVAFREGRDVGGMVRGSFAGGRLAYYVALVNGNGINVPANSGAGLTLVSRVEVMPLGAVPYDTTQTLSGHAPVRFSLAAGSYVDLVPDGDAVVGGDATFVAGPFILLAEAYLGWQEGRSTQRRGAYAQVGVTIVPDRLQLGLRASVLDPNADLGNDYQRSIEGLVALYALGNHAKLNLRYTFTDLGSASTLAPAPSSHALTAQIQGWI
ncbi:MAG: hypothetical protein IPI43_04955 [Sandaracinaceae bacterium]|nr:hypothetical protein [Sandaracinaceae bacterium]